MTHWVRRSRPHRHYCVSCGSWLTCDTPSCNGEMAFGTCHPCADLDPSFDSALEFHPYTYSSEQADQTQNEPA